MCARFTLVTPAGELAEAFDLEEIPSLEPRYNIAPTQPVAAVRRRESGSKRELALLRWGLVPPWVKSLRIGARMINARAETLSQRPAFREAFKHRRCLIPADGFYEWRREGKRKQPFYFRLRGGGLFAFAGLWERWEGQGDAVESCTLLTTDANELLRSFHERMPVILDPKDYEAWLDPGMQGEEKLRPLLMKAYPQDEIASHAVGLRVNSPRNDDPSCIEPFAPPPML
ncbi:MAG: SOS response-associated peptidase [Acidobacteriota bacterium]|nr:MAG: SOS response-associated peptidase [Acidobacteriota bacterium]